MKKRKYRHIPQDIIVDDFLEGKLVILTSDNSGVLFIDKQILLVTSEGYYLGVIYYCTQCGLKNPHVRWRKKMNEEEILGFNGLHKEIRQQLGLPKPNSKD